MILTAIQDEVKARGFDPASTTRLNYWINRAYHRICDREAWPFLETTTTGNSPLTISDLRSVISVADTTNDSILLPEDIRTLRDIDPGLNDTGTPSVWYASAPTIISCWPTTVTALSVRYIKTPTDLSSGSDTPVVPTRYQYAIVDGACAYAYRDKDNAEMAQVCEDSFEKAIIDMADTLLSTSYDGSPYIILGNSTDW